MIFSVSLLQRKTIDNPITSNCHVCAEPVVKEMERKLENKGFQTLGRFIRVDSIKMSLREQVFH